MFAFLDMHMFKVSIIQWAEFSCSFHRPNNAREALELRKYVCVASMTHLENEYVEIQRLQLLFIAIY